MFAVHLLHICVSEHAAACGWEGHTLMSLLIASAGKRGDIDRCGPAGEVPRPEDILALSLACLCLLL
jgi:hypothetical protein